MQVVRFSKALESVKAVLDREPADADVTPITRRHAQGAVVISLDIYNSLIETVHRRTERPQPDCPPFRLPHHKAPEIGLR